MTPLDQYIDRMTFIKSYPNKKPGLHLHMGCGPAVLEGFINIDGYVDHPGVTKLDMADPMTQWQGQVDSIYSSHSLEHLPMRTGLLVLNNWANLLKPGGKLFLAVPDLEEICRIMVNPQVADDAKWNWYAYTLFGYQTDPSISASDRRLDLPIFPGQFHTSGYTVDRLRKLMAERQLKINEVICYDGWGTPSIFIEAEK